MNDPLTKLYAGLTDKERGKLAFTYRTQHNDLETARIESAMSQQYFTGLPLEYRRMTASLQNLALMYSVAYWQQVALCLCYFSGVQALIHDDDPEACKPMMERLKSAEESLMALEQAFEDVCLEHGLDAGAMRYMAGRQFYTIATPDLEPDDTCLAGYREIFEDAF